MSNGINMGSRAITILSFEIFDRLECPGHERMMISI